MPRSAPFPLFHLHHFFRPGLTIVPRSLLLNCTETLATRAMAERESSVALCHGVASKKKGSVADLENVVALCHGVALKKKGSVEDRESGVALCHKVAFKQKRERDRSRTERAVGSLRYGDYGLRTTAGRALYVCMYVCKSLFEHGKSSVKLKLKTKTNYNCFT